MAVRGLWIDLLTAVIVIAILLGAFQIMRVPQPAAVYVPIGIGVVYFAAQYWRRSRRRTA